MGAAVERASISQVGVHPEIPARRSVAFVIKVRVANGLMTGPRIHRHRNEAIHHAPSIDRVVIAPRAIHSRRRMIDASRGKPEAALRIAAEEVAEGNHATAAIPATRRLAVMETDAASRTGTPKIDQARQVVAVEVG